MQGLYRNLPVVPPIRGLKTSGTTTANNELSTCWFRPLGRRKSRAQPNNIPSVESGNPVERANALEVVLFKASPGLKSRAIAVLFPESTMSVGCSKIRRIKFPENRFLQ